jgi:hypothetical protein
MHNVTRIISLLIASIIIVLGSKPLFAGERMGWELPDPVFIRNECQLLRELGEKYSKPHVQPVQAACESVMQGNVSPEQWLRTVDPLAREIDSKIPCRACIRIVLEERQPIPDSFSSYSVFLVPTELLADQSQVNATSALREAFDAFGSAIGDRRAAIWFSTTRHRSPRGQNYSQPARAF